MSPIRPDARHDLAKDPPLRFRRSDSPSRNLRREDDASFGRRFGAAARRLVARRGRQQQHVALALDEHRRREHDVLVDAQPRSAERAARSCLVAERLEKIAADDPEQIDGAVSRVRHHFGGGPAQRFREPESPTLPTSARACLRVDARLAPDLRTALHAGVAANRHQPGVRSSMAARAPRPTLTSAFTVSTPCACCVSPIDQTKIVFGRAISRSANVPISLARETALAFDRVPGRGFGEHARPGRTRSCDRARTSRRCRAARSSARSTPIRNARSPPVCTSNQWSASAVPKNGARRRSMGSSSASAPARDRG